MKSIDELILPGDYRYADGHKWAKAEGDKDKNQVSNRFPGLRRVITKKQKPRLQQNQFLTTFVSWEKSQF